MKRKIAGLYDPYLDTLGGGERYALSIMKVLEDAGYEIQIFWDKNLSSDIKKRFDLDFKKLNFRGNIFKKGGSFLQKQKILNDIDLFLYITDGSYFFSLATKNFIYAMVPDKKLYDMSVKNSLILLNWKFITHSRFTQHSLKDWEIKSEVLYPYVNKGLLKKNTAEKEKIILTVGRFFTHLHAKKHDQIIKLFKKNKSKFLGYKLILAGGLKKEDQTYFNKLKKIAGNDKSIIFKTNLSYENLMSLYKKSSIYWHFAGFGINENTHPELVEHLGITPIEAMAAGCMTFVYNAGGPKEVIENNINGFIFSTEKELIAKTQKIIKDEKLQMIIKNNAKNYVKNNFSYDGFETEVKNLLQP